jgi:O-antigen/teichoic acid export membrane protein
VDQLVVGHVLGAVALGFYVLAANLANWPVSMFSQPLRSVAPALFARLQDDRVRMEAAFGQVLRPLAAISLPACLAISATAPDIVAFVYGSAWEPAGEVLRWLALLAFLRILFELSYDYLVVRGRSRTILSLQVVWIVALVPAIWLAVEDHGLGGASAALVAVAALISLPLYLRALRQVGVPPRHVLGSCLLPAVAAAALYALGVVTCAVVGSSFAALALVGSATVATAGLLLWSTRADLAVFREVRAS